VAGDARVLVVGEGLADALRGRLAKQLQTAEAELAKAASKLANERFVQNAPAAVVREEREREARFGREVAELRDRLRELGV